MKTLKIAVLEHQVKANSLPKHRSFTYHPCYCSLNIPLNGLKKKKTSDQYLVLSLAAAQHQGRSRVEDRPEQPVGDLTQFLCTSLFHPVFPPPQGNWGQVALLVLVLRAPVSIFSLSFLWPRSSSSGLHGPQQRRQRAQRSTMSRQL